jgi:hypothetical protein
VALVLRINRDVVHEHDPPPRHLALGEPEAANHGPVRLDDEDVVAGRVEAHRQDCGEVGFGLLERSLVRLAAMDLDALRKICDATPVSC